MREGKPVYSLAKRALRRKTRRLAELTLAQRRKAFPKQPIWTWLDDPPDPTTPGAGRSVVRAALQAAAKLGAKFRRVRPDA